MNELRQLRRKADLSQRDFAELLNVPINTFRMWDSGLRPVPDPWELQYLMGAIALETVPVGADGGGHSGPVGRLQQVYDAWTSMAFVSCRATVILTPSRH